jgi:hypothetical protein
MQFLLDLWLPILINGVVLFFASFAAWVLLPHHFSDKKKLPDEDKLMQQIGDLKISPGNYMFPYTTTKAEQNSKEHMAKYSAGPRGCLDVWEMPNMGLNMAYSFLFFLITSTVIGYITHVACPPGGDGVDFMRIFRIAGTIGILTHASSGVLNGIWFKRRLWTDILDGIAYGLILGLIFAALWPSGA